MRRSLIAVALLALAGCQTGSGPAGASQLGPYCGKNAPSWMPGHYTLNGVMEVGSELMLKPDGSFQFYLAYGANDQAGKGCWTTNGKTVALFPNGKTTLEQTHTPDSRGFGGMVLLVEGRDLVWRIPGWRYTGRYEK